MVRIYAIVLFSVFSLYLVLPVIPWVDYYLNRTYIIENLCVQKDEPVNTCNGCCHLTKEITKVVDDTSEPLDSKPANTKEISISPTVISVFLCCNKKDVLQLQEHVLKPFQNNYSFTFINTPFHPPKSSI